MIELDICLYMGFPGGSDGKEPACNAEDPGLILGLERSPREGHDYPLQYSCLENSINRGAWQATVHGVTELDMTDQLTLSYFQNTVSGNAKWQNCYEKQHGVSSKN